MDDKIKVVFRGHIMRKMYAFEDGRSVYSVYYYMPYIYDTKQHVEYEKFHECTINRPPFEKDEKVFITDLNLEVKIEGIMRSTTDEYVYDTNYIVCVLDDDISSDNKKEAEQKLTEELVRYNNWKNPVLIAEENKKKWYQFWK